MPAAVNAAVTASVPETAWSDLKEKIRSKLGGQTVDVPVTANASVSASVPNNVWSDFKEKFLEKMGEQTIDVPVTVETQVAIDKEELKTRIKEAWSNAVSEETVQGGVEQPSASSSLGEILFGKPENWGIEEAITGIFTGGTLATTIGSAVAGAVTAGAVSGATTRETTGRTQTFPAAIRSRIARQSSRWVQWCG